MGGYHAVPWSDAWAVLRSGARRAMQRGLTRRVAWDEARRRARGIALGKGRPTAAYLHDKGGRIVVRTLYGEGDKEAA